MTPIHSRSEALPLASQTSDGSDLVCAPPPPSCSTRVPKAAPNAVSKADANAVSKADANAVSKADANAVSKADANAVSKAEPNAVSKAEPNAVQKADPNAVYRDNDAQQGRVDRALERAFLERFSAIPPGARGQLEMQGELKLKYGAQLKASFTVERDREGAYTVTLDGSVGAGLIADAGVAKVSALAGVKGNVTLRFSSAEEAADKLAALTLKGAMVTSSPISPLRLAGDDHLDQRALGALRNITTVELGVFGEVKGELDLLLANAGAHVGVEVKARLDLERGRLVFETAVETGVEAEAKLEIGAIGAQGLKVNGSVSAEAGGSVALQSRRLLRAELAVTADEVRGLMDGTISPSQLARLDRFEISAVDTLTGRLNGAQITAQREVPFSSIGVALGLEGDEARWVITGGFHNGLAGRAGLNAKVAEFETRVSIQQTLVELPPDPMTTREVVELVAGAVRRELWGARKVEADRALAALRSD
jgi:hypothetical protein